MKYYINVKFGAGTKNYYFATDDETLIVGDHVVVDTIVGLELAEVTTAPLPLETLAFDREIKPILRKATEEDLKTYAWNEELSENASRIFIRHIEELNLDMRLLGAQYTLDRAKILFTYAADDRVDFRDLLKLLASDLHCRIELKQVNSRERAQIVGGLGVCGLPLCCTTFLTHFDGVSLNKAKNQMLTINIPKLSGQCDRLMCCLKFEDDYYTEAKKEFPAVGTKIFYQDAEYKISSFNIFNKIIKIQNSTDVAFLSLDEVNSILYKGKTRRPLTLDKTGDSKANEPTQKEETKAHENTNKPVHKVQKDKVENSHTNEKPSTKNINKPTNKNVDSKKDNNKNERKDVHHSKDNRPKNNVNNKHNQNKNTQKVDKKLVKDEQKHVENQNQSIPTQFMFAGQANKMKEYQDTYAKNNPDKKYSKPHSQHRNNHKKPADKNIKADKGN